jgi:excisionase family DNA binding protein
MLFMHGSTQAPVPRALGADGPWSKSLRVISTLRTPKLPAVLLPKAALQKPFRAINVEVEMGDQPERRNRRTVSLSEAAEVLGISRSTAYKLFKQGALPVPVLEIGAVLRVSIVHLDRYLQTGTPIASDVARSDAGAEPA